MSLEEKYEELDQITEQMFEITDISLEDDEDGNPRRPSDEQFARGRELMRRQRELLKEIKELERPDR